MIDFTMSKLAKMSAVLLVGLAMAGAPALAEKGGNGNGGGNGSSHGGGQGNGNGKSGEHGRGAEMSAKGKARAEAAMTAGKLKGKTASSLGKLNGFMHASASALTHASPKSAIGKVAKVYAGVLNNYLTSADGVTIDQVAAALKSASNKDLSPEIIAAVNARLFKVNGTLSTSLTASGKDPAQLAADIAAAM